MITAGRIIHYVLTADDAAAINRRRTNGRSIATRIDAGSWPMGAQAHIGNEAFAEDHFPAIVVRVWPNEFGGGVNAQVFLDGNDQYWVTSIKEGDDPGTWHFPERD